MQNQYRVLHVSFGVAHRCPERGVVQAQLRQDLARAETEIPKNNLALLGLRDVLRDRRNCDNKSQQEWRNELSHDTWQDFGF